MVAGASLAYWAYVQCALLARVAWSCYRWTTPIATTRETVLVDPSLHRGATYRVRVGVELDRRCRRGTSSRSVGRNALARSEPSGSLLEERHALGELHVLVREPRDHRGVVEQDEEDEEGRNGE